MRKPKALNPPERIFLQVGDIDEDCEFSECEDSGEVTWCADRQWDTDIEYRLVRRKRRSREQVVKAAMADVGLGMGKEVKP